MTMIDFDILNKKEHLSMNENVFLAGSKIPTKKALCYVRWAHPVNIIVLCSAVQCAQGA